MEGIEGDVAGGIEKRDKRSDGLSNLNRGDSGEMSREREWGKGKKKEEKYERKRAERKQRSQEEGWEGGREV